MRPPRLFVGALGGVLLGGAGCPVYAVVEPEPDPCAGVACGYAAHCEAGGCVCDAGYVPDENSPGDCAAVLRIRIEDGCPDEMDVAFRIWSDEGDWVWPGGDDVFWTGGLGVETVAEIACIDGQGLCFGAAAGPLEWGVGLDGDLACSGCCFTCFPGTVDVGVLTCPSGAHRGPTPAAHDAIEGGDSPKGDGVARRSWEGEGAWEGPQALDKGPHGWHVPSMERAAGGRATGHHE